MPALDYVFLALPTLCAAPAAQSPDGHETAARIVRPAMMPEAVASFGAASCDDGHVYVFGGHTGRPHAHSRQNVTSAFRRLNLVDGSSWEDLPPSGFALQGTSLVGRNGALWRIGGLAALNAPHESDDLRSTASVQRFDPAERRWFDETPLPEPRSSHDAWIVGDRVFVVGGWNLQGDSEHAVWHDTAWVANLRETPLVWQPLKAPPFRRRALAVAASGRRLVVIGGIDEDGKVQSRVDVLDLDDGTWARGPDFPGSAFGPSAVTVDGDLYASGRSGHLLRLDGEKAQRSSAAWTPVTTLTSPRFFHRLVATGPDSILALGGVAGGHARTTETLDLSIRAGDAPVFEEWVVPFAGDIRSRFAVALDRGHLLLIGGNRSLGQHHFGEGDFSDETWKLSLSRMSLERLPDAPVSRQSMQAARLGPSVLVFGGFGFDGEFARGFGDVLQFEPRSGEWFTDHVELPSPRSKFHAETFEDAVWLFGGADHDPRRTEGERDRHCLAVPRVRLHDGVVEIDPEETRLPRPRRAFGAARVGDRLYLVGGIRDGYEPVSEIDVFDFHSRAWSEAAKPPRTRLGPQVAALGERIYVAGGSVSSEDGDFAPARALECFDPASEDWRVVVPELPFSMKHVRMLVVGHRLVFVSTHFEDPARMILRAFDPARCLGEAPVVVEAAVLGADH